MSMKTVWHWKEIGKAALVILGVALVWVEVTSALDLSEGVAFISGLAVGGVAGVVTLNLFDMFHFE